MKSLIPQMLPKVRTPSWNCESILGKFQYKEIPHSGGTKKKSHPLPKPKKQVVVQSLESLQKHLREHKQAEEEALVNLVSCIPHLCSKRSEYRTRIRRMRKEADAQILIPHNTFQSFLISTFKCPKCPSSIQKVEILKDGIQTLGVNIHCELHHSTFRPLSVEASNGVLSGRLKENVRMAIARLVFSPSVVQLERIFAAAGLGSVESLPLPAFDILLEEMTKLYEEEVSRQVKFLNMFHAPTDIMIDTQWCRSQHPLTRGGQAHNACTAFLSMLTGKVVYICATSQATDLPSTTPPFDLTNEQGEQDLLAGEEPDEDVKSLEKLGTGIGIDFLIKELTSIGAVCHDKCSSTSKHFKKILRAHPYARDCLDSWHVLKRVVAHAAELEQNNLEDFSGLAKAVQGILFDLILSNPIDGEKRKQEWMYLNWCECFNSRLSRRSCETLRLFCREHAADIGQMYPEGTSLCESYNNHNLIFFSKHLHYHPSVWKIKMMAAYLYWNEVPNWFQIFLERSLRRFGF